MTGPVTLGDLILADKLLWVYCTACGHERDISPATVPLPPETPVPDFGGCKRDPRPELYPGGIVATHNCGSVTYITDAAYVKG